jgi:hypothetical protein
MNKIIFVKPTQKNFVSETVFEVENKIYLDEAIFADSAKELNQKVSEMAVKNPCHIRYDVSVFMQEGKDLRAQIPDTNVFCYKPKSPLLDRITAQIEWLNENLVIDSLYENKDYILFVELFKEYRIGDETCNPVAADVLSDVAKYYRREMAYE